MSTIEDDVLNKFTKALEANATLPADLPEAIKQELAMDKGGNAERLANIYRLGAGGEAA
jgi:hypothetical protein